MSEFNDERPAALSLLVSHNRTQFREFAFASMEDERERFVEAPPCRNRSSRGVITGVLLGAGLWTVILASTGVIKL
jgi:hypothetical protein